MPRVIVDSDDESDDEVYVSASENAQQGNAVANPDFRDANEAGAIASLDGISERSTSSAELLKRQILSAERHLLTNSAPTAVTRGQNSSSPSMGAQKRRHTSAFEEEVKARPGSAVKRTKTVMYDGQAPKTSQSARFMEHSGYQSSAELPAGSFGAEFANHEPNIMFRETGSTVPDDSSAQQRMIEQALSSKKGLSTSAVNQLQDEEQKSSSFPWSASRQTPSAKTTSTIKSANGVPGDGESTAENQITEEGTTGDSGTNETIAVTTVNQHASAKDTDDSIAVQVTSKSPANPDAGDEIAVRSPSKPQASPIVQISQPTRSNTKTSRRDSTSTVKSTKTCKRKAEEDEDSAPLNSDDRAIGLPRERYQPRPSRRRSTQVVEEPIDYSVRPEKAAKAKRTKTAVHSTNADAEISKEHLANLKADVEKAKTPSEQSRDRPTTTEDAVEGEVKATTTSAADEDVVTNADPTTDATPSNPTENAPQSSGKKNEDHVFVMPALPTPKPKQASKSRRSRTTIFEDHVEFTGSQKSLTLSQQQAGRKQSQEDIRASKPQASQRKRRVVDDEDGDEEDELAKDPDDAVETVTEDQAPKKRGRGRPAKTKASEKSTEKVLEDSEDENEERDDEEEDEPSKKRSRGRPPKSTSTTAPPGDPITAPEKEKSAADAVDKPTAAEQTQSNPVGAGNEAPTNAPKSSGLGKENLTPSPSPEKEAQKPASTPQQESKPSPTLHSPIKSSSAVPLRVGLSNRRRIPSLLKTVKGPRT